MQAVPRGLREGAYAIGATKYQTSTRVDRAGGHVRDHRLVRARPSRAPSARRWSWLIGAGLLPTMTVDPRLQSETMTAFIAATGIGDMATGIDRVQDDLRRRPDPVRR